MWVQPDRKHQRPLPGVRNERGARRMKASPKRSTRFAFWTCGLATLAICLVSCFQTPYYALPSYNNLRGYEVSIYCGNLCIESQPGPPQKLGWHHYSIGRQTEPNCEAWTYASAHGQPWG